MPGTFDAKHYGTIVRIYSDFHKPEYIYPDPLHIVRRFENLQDQEIAGFICASLALGRVRGILSAAESVLREIPDPCTDIFRYSTKDFLEIFRGFRYRFFGCVELSSFLTGIKRILETFGSIESCFLKGYDGRHDTVMPALVDFVRRFSAYSENGHGMLLSRPEKGGAAKRLHLFLRWMVRKDEVDPGCWESVSAEKLLYPMDTHMLTVAGILGLPVKGAASLKTALDVTGAFRSLCPEDPVKFDFSLTRPGIHPMLSVEKEYSVQTRRTHAS